MIDRNPTKEEFALSNSMRHFVQKGENALFKNGKEQFKQCAIDLGYDKKYPWVYDCLFTSTVNWAKKWPSEAGAAESIGGIHRRDGRTPAVYAIDLCSNWVIEDFTILTLEKLGFEIQRNGIDKFRTINASCISNSPDILIKSSGTEKWYQMELSVSYTNLIKSTHKFRLRDNKYKHLKDRNAFILQLEFPTKIAVSYIPSEDTSDFLVNYIECFRPFGGKSAYEIEIANKTKEVPLSGLSTLIKNTFLTIDRIETSCSESIKTDESFIDSTNQESIDLEFA